MAVLSGSSLSRYLEEVGRIPLLTRERELQVSGALTEAREELLREYARIPEAVEEICQVARRAEAGEVSMERYFDFDESPRGRGASGGTFVVRRRRIERDLAALRRCRKDHRGDRASLDVRLEAIRQRLVIGVMSLCPTEPIIVKAEERVRQLLQERRMPGSLLSPDGDAKGNGHRVRPNGNGNGNGHGHGNAHGQRSTGHATHRRGTPPRGSLEESLSRIRAARQRFEECRRILAESNLRLAIAVAKHYRNRGVPLGDLIQEGNLGLLRACDRFDSRRGYRFSTYAVYWIRQSIVRALPEQSRTVRVPPHLTDLLARFLECRTRLAGSLGREPEASEVLDQIGVDRDKMARAQALPLEVLSLDGQIGEDGEPTSWDLPDHRGLSPLQEVERSGVALAVKRVAGRLSSREVQVLGMRFGLHGQREMTLEEIGRQFAVTRERVRQIQEEALRKLRGSELFLLGGRPLPGAALAPAPTALATQA